MGVLVDARDEGRRAFTCNRQQIKPKNALRTCETDGPKANPQKAALID